MPERRVWFLVGWVEPDLQCWVSYLNPTYENQAFNTIWFQGAKPNKSIRRVFDQSLTKIFVTRIKMAVRQAHGPERSRRAGKRQKQTFKVNIGFLKSNEIKLRSEASSLFDVRCWMFDVRRSSFKTTLYGVNVPCECLQNNLALMGFIPARKGLSVE